MLNFVIFGLASAVAFARNGTREIIANVETVYEKPASPARGIVVLAHGCQHSATDFWPHSTACAECIGLPEVPRDCCECMSVPFAETWIAGRCRRCASLAPSSLPAGWPSHSRQPTAR